MARRPDPDKVPRVPDDRKLSGREDRTDHSVAAARREPKRRACPERGCWGRVHERRTRKARHLPAEGAPPAVLLEVVRLECPGCEKTRYDDRSDLAGGLSPHITADLGFAITVDVIDKTGIAAVSRKEGPSEELVTKVPGAAVLRCSYLPRTLCTGGFAAHAEKGRFAVAVSDGDRRCLVEIPGRPRGDVLGDFSGGSGKGERGRAGLFACDMPGASVAAKKLWFPAAKLCTGRFHVVKEAATACALVRVRAADPEETDENGDPTKEGRFTAKEKKETKNARRWFRMRRPGPGRVDAERATDLAERRDRLREQLVDMDPRDIDDVMPRPKAPKCGVAGALPGWDREPEVARQLPQWSCLWSDMRWCADERDGPGKRREAATRSGIPESEAAARTFREHREGIPDGYRHDKTNALAEGPDNTTELLKKTSYGMPTFARMRRRRLFALGRYRLSRDRVHLPQAGAGGKPRARKRGDGDGPAAAAARKRPSGHAVRGTGVMPLNMLALPRKKAVMPLA